MRIPIRPRDPEDVPKDGEGGLHKRVSIVSKLAQLERERDRISRQRATWQDQIDLTDARLAQIGEVQERLQRLLSHPEVVLRRVGGVAADSTRPLADPVAERHQVTATQY